MSEPLKYTDLTAADIQAARDRAAADKLLAERRAKQRDRTRASRANSKEARAKALKQEPIETMWLRNSNVLLTSNPTLYQLLQEAHDDIEASEAEVQEIVRGVSAGNKRAETLSALTPDPENVMPCPDVCYRDIKTQIEREGTLNYRQIESMSQRPEGGGDLAPCFRPAVKEKFSQDPNDAIGSYRFFGFRTRLENDVLRDITDALCLYFLRTGDASLDIDIVREAIKDRETKGGWHHNDQEFKSLLAKRRKSSALSFEEQVVKTVSDLEASGSYEL